MTAHAVLPITSYRLDKAILIYSRHSSGETDSWYDSDRHEEPRSFASVHEVQLGADGQPELGVGRPATEQGISALARDLLGERAPGAVPARTLAIGSHGVAWYVPPGHREMHFRTSNDALQALSGKRVAHPGLVFSASASGASRSLRVWAFRRRGRPRADTALYQAPFLNVSQGGSVCLGSTDAPYTATASDAPVWTDAFFASAFTHVHGQPVNGRGPSYAALLSALADSGDQFPGNRLVPARLHLRHVLG